MGRSKTMTRMVKLCVVAVLMGLAATARAQTQEDFADAVMEMIKLTSSEDKTGKLQSHIKALLIMKHKELQPQVSDERANQLAKKFLAEKFENGLLKPMFVSMMEGKVSLEQIKEVTEMLKSDEGRAYTEHSDAVSADMDMIKNLVTEGGGLNLNLAYTCPDSYAKKFATFYECAMKDKMDAFWGLLETSLSMSESEREKKEIETALTFMKEKMPIIMANSCYETLTEADIDFGLKLNAMPAYACVMRGMNIENLLSNTMQTRMDFVASYEEWLKTQDVSKAEQEKKFRVKSFMDEAYLVTKKNETYVFYADMQIPVDCPALEKHLAQKLFGTDADPLEAEFNKIREKVIKILEKQNKKVYLRVEDGAEIVYKTEAGQLAYGRFIPYYYVREYTSKINTIPSVKEEGYVVYDMTQDRVLTAGDILKPETIETLGIAGLAEKDCILLVPNQDKLLIYCNEKEVSETSHHIDAGLDFPAILQYTNTVTIDILKSTNNITDEFKEMVNIDEIIQRKKTAQELAARHAAEMLARKIQEELAAQRTESVSNEKPVSLNTGDANNAVTAKADIKHDGHIFTVVEQMPSFPGGQGALLEYLAKNIHYPAVAEENRVQGRVIVTFVVERNGSITEAKVTKSVDPSLDKEALRVIRSMPNWIPGRLKGGEAVRVKYTTPVTFRLQ